LQVPGEQIVTALCMLRGSDGRRRADATHAPVTNTTLPPEAVAITAVLFWIQAKPRRGGAHIRRCSTPARCFVVFGVSDMRTPSSALPLLAGFR
jgi:hypothetical protein